MIQVNLSMKHKKKHMHREQTLGCKVGGSWGRDAVGAWG